VLPDLDRFFADVEKQCGGDTRFGDPTYLAAKFVVWQAAENARYYPHVAYEEGGPLAFLGVGVTTNDAGDGEYIYTVECGGIGYGSNQRPSVECTNLYGDE
jgi:hypothetical protein